jgi:hypothetical protein
MTRFGGAVESFNLEVIPVVEADWSPEVAGKAGNNQLDGAMEVVRAV